ncbi:hypothetical protein PV396_35530 [Streptomyces sp. ME02-8801-2C]|uniref:hypothetical protein n=1 Tax=Streptomyces sp. ME02-8801-2C TaxID=3028680 RepID=UPI0029A33F15|nr:hypothetical protein [Streptomyces sp. ME02-8801-2C]MDX3457209.1 hypothetical protein [Streptomyces sp. ME02-8801-2C]
MARQREQYGILYEGDFGLSALAEKLSVTTGYPDETQALRLASEVAAAAEGEGAVELGVDVRCLLDAPLPDDIIRTAWLAAARGRFDPAACESGVRGWLRRLAERWPEHERRQAHGQWDVRPGIEEEELRTAVGAEIRVSAGTVDQGVAESDHVALPSGAVAESLEAVARQGDGDLGLRLFLRVLKEYDVPVDKEQYGRLMALDTALGLPGPLVYDGLNVLWPPIDTARRDASGDFGLSALTSWFEGGWQESTARERVRQAAAADDSAQTPGSAAALLLADAGRLLDSSLRTETIKVLWLSATGRGYNIDHLGTDAKAWLRLIEGVCEERLREIAPQYRHAGPSDRSDFHTDIRSAVLRAVREAAPLLKESVISPHWEPIPGATALAAVEEVVTDVDADLGFRLLLRLLDVVSPSLTQELYSHYQALGRRFGYGEDHVTGKLEQLVRQS